MLYRRSLFLAAALLSFLLPTFAQQTAAPTKEEKLLNGLRVLLWNDPTAPKVSVKLRIHSGAAFDPQEKEGVMAMLAEAIFPSDEAREYFADDLGGSLDINTNYDYIEITATSKPEAYLSLLETLSNAVANPVIDRETTTAVKSRVLKKVSANEQNASYAADLAVRKRLLGTFPYGRPVAGSTDSLARIDFADLRFAYDRLFGADNATLTVSGNFPVDVGYRAIRRYFGSWLKSDKKAPSTFRQPDPPPAGTQIAASPEPGVSELRYAFRGVARSDKDHAAASVLARILEARLKAKAPEDQRANVFVQNDSNVLPGVIILGISKIRNDMTASLSTEKPKFEANDMIAGILAEKISESEFNTAKAAALRAFEQHENAERWIDADTFRLAGVKTDIAAFNAVSISNVQQYADRLKQQPVASVLLLAPKTSN